jgi:hydroxymethylbilane synthase
MGRKLVIGTRGSALALWQAEWVQTSLRRASGREAELKIIRTSGDRDQTTPLGQLGGRGVFTKEIERALLDGEVDLAVHSLKDLPTDLPAGLALGAVGPREDPRDALVARSAASFEALPEGARVGTGSLRRRGMLLHARPDLRMQDLRGNLDTRLRKLETEGLDAIVLAVAGLSRMGWAGRITERIPLTVCLPDAGQGAVGVEVRADDAEAVAAAGGLDHADTRRGVTAERAVLKGLGGGCQVPIGAWGRVAEGRLKLDAAVASVDGRRMIRDSGESAPEEAEALGQRLAERLLKAGAGEILGER